MPIDRENRGVRLSGQPDDQFHLIINNVPAMVWTARPDGFCDFINRRWLEYTGLSLEEGLGAGFVAMHPEDRPQFLAQWEQAVQTGTPLECEIRLRRADGEYCDNRLIRVNEFYRDVAIVVLEIREPLWFGTRFRRSLRSLRLN